MTAVNYEAEYNNRERVPEHLGIMERWTAASVALFVATFAFLVGRWRRATPALRRVLRPVYLAGGLKAVFLNFGTSKRTPRFSLRFCPTRHSSCA